MSLVQYTCKETHVHTILHRWKTRILAVLKICVSLSFFDILIPQAWGPLMVAQWLRYCATNRKVAGSIREGVVGIYH
jgi:hypothetical protein